MSSFLETSEGSCYSSAYTAAAAGGGGTQLLSTLHNSAALPAELGPWGGRGSSSLTGASSAASACCEAYASASVSQEGFSGALCGRAAPSGGGGLLMEERTGTVTEEEDEGTGRRQTLRQPPAPHRDTFRDALECSGGSQQAEVAAGRSESVVTVEDMSAQEAEERVRGLYRRLRGADHFRSLPALDLAAAAAAGSSPDHRPESVAEFRRVRRPVPHFSAERDLVSIHIQLRAQLVTLQGCLEEPLRGDLHKYVDFIGTSCLDAEDETLKREMAEKVMRLLLQRKGAAAGAEPTWDAADYTQDTSGAVSQPSGRSAVTAESGWEAERWLPRTGPLCSRVPTPYSRERPVSPIRRVLAASPPSRRGSGAAAEHDRLEQGEVDRRSGAWRHQLTRSERRLQAGSAEADGEQSEASEAAWRSHNYGGDPCDNHEDRPTDTTTSDYDFNTIRSRQRRLEDATASSFEYYDPGPRRHRSSPDEGASGPEPTVRPAVGSPAREASPPSPAPTPGPNADLLGLLRHTTDNVIRHSRELRTRRTPVPLSVRSGAAAPAAPAPAAADGRRRRPRSGDTAGSRRSSARTASGETSRQLGTLVGQHRQKHVQQLQHEITKLGRLERMLLAGSAVQLDGCDSSEGGAATGSDCRRGVEGRSSPSDSGPDSDSKAEDEPPPPGPSSAYSRIRETLQRRRRQIEAQLADMDGRHRRYGRRLERFADPAEQAPSDSEESAASCQRTDTHSSSQRRRPAASTTGAGGRRPRTGSDSQRRAVTSQETSTQTSSWCEPGSAGASVQVHRRRRRVPAAATGSQTVSSGRQPDGTVQVFTRRTRLPPSDSATQTASSGPRRQRSAGSPSRTVTVTRRQPSPGSPSPRRSHVAVQTTSSPERTVTVTRRRPVPAPTVSRPGGVSKTTGGPGRSSAAGRQEVMVRRRPVASGGSAETETVTTADTTADTAPSSATTREGMRDVLEPSDRTGQRSEDVERAERLLETVRRSSAASRATDAEDGPASSRPGSSSLRSDSLSGAGRDAGGPDRSLDARRAQLLLRQGVRLDQLEQALWKAESQEPPSCPVSPRRDWPSSSDQSRSVGTQTCLLAADGGALRSQTVRRQVHSDDSEVIHHPPRPPAARRSVAYFLSVRCGPPSPPPDDEDRCRRVLPAVRLSQELLASSGSEPAPGAECVREEDEECSERGRRVSVTRRRPAGRPCAAECLSLQEALCQRRPDYIRNAAVRRQYLQRLAELRRTNLERVARAAQTLPQLPTDADWCHFADSLRPENVRRAFDYRDMRQHTERLWRRLPEIRDCVAKRKKHAQFRTNRLMWQVYRQKLQERCLRGDVHMTHRDAVLGGL